MVGTRRTPLIFWKPPQTRWWPRGHPFGQADPLPAARHPTIQAVWRCCWQCAELCRAWV